MRRFATLDFLRGFSIFLMIILHLISEVLNIGTLLAHLNTIPLINIVLLFILPFLGGLAGLFLMVSAASNMVSMYKQLEKGISITNLVLKQVVGGVLLLFFAMLSEGFFSFWGPMGDLFGELNTLVDPATFPYDFWRPILWLFNNFETIHTIAWCVILNGITQGLLSLKGGWKSPKKLILIYALLTIIVVALTNFVWTGLYQALGYPWQIDPNTGLIMQFPVIGKSSFWKILRGVFLAPLAAPMEPIFPYLAVSYIGSIIGIVIVQDPATFSRHHLKKLIFIAFGMFLIGLVGLVIMYINIISVYGFDAAVGLYRLLSWHRHYSPEISPIVPPFGWLWQFLCVTGFSMLAVTALMRVVEYRGKAQQFGDKTRFFRRFGFTALTNYALQFMTLFIFYLISLIFIGTPYAGLNWGLTILCLVLAILQYLIVMLLWERIGFIGSFEWWIGTLGALILPSIRKKADSVKHWWQRGQLDVEGAFYHVEWINLYTVDDYAKEYRTDSKLALIGAIVGFVFPLFLIAHIITIGIALTAQKNEGSNRYNRSAFVLSLIGICILVAFLIGCFVLTPASIGLAIF